MKDEICAYIGRELLSGRADVGPDDALLTGGILDSLGVIQVVAFIREEFGVVIPPEDVTLENFESVARIEAYVKGLGPDG